MVASRCCGCELYIIKVYHFHTHMFISGYLAVVILMYTPNQCCCGTVINLQSIPHPQKNCTDLSYDYYTREFTP